MWLCLRTTMTSQCWSESTCSVVLINKDLSMEGIYDLLLLIDSNLGLYGFAFVDFGNGFKCSDANGETSAPNFITLIT